jgi:hypothetical protein
MKSISLAIIGGIFDMLIGMFKKVQALSKTDRLWQEWLMFVVFAGLTFFLLYCAYQVSIDIIMASPIPELREVVK